jgi:transcriptional regulator with XRE-family HTH domain
MQQHPRRMKPRVSTRAAQERKGRRKKKPMDGEGFSELAFGLAIGALIDASGMSLRATARALEVDVSYLSRLRTGALPPPPDRTLERFARGLGVRPEYFLEYRVRRIAEALGRDPALVTFLYDLYKLPAARRRALMQKILKPTPGASPARRRSR